MHTTQTSLDTELTRNAAQPRLDLTDEVDTASIPPDLSAGAFVPPVLHTISETGLSTNLFEHLIFNILYNRGAMIGRGLADVLAIGFEAIEALMTDLKTRHAVEVKSSEGYGLASSLFALSEMGRKRAREYFDINQYSGKDG